MLTATPIATICNIQGGKTISMNFKGIVEEVKVLLRVFREVLFILILISFFNNSLPCSPINNHLHQLTFTYLLTP